MQPIITFFKKPYAEKGLIVGTIDLLLKMLTLCVWGYAAVILSSLFIESMVIDFDPANKVWWFSYCFLIFFGISWLTYIVWFVRDYNED